LIVASLLLAGGQSIEYFCFEIHFLGSDVSVLGAASSSPPGTNLGNANYGDFFKWTAAGTEAGASSSLAPLATSDDGKKTGDPTSEAQRKNLEFAWNLLDTLHSMLTWPTHAQLRNSSQEDIDHLRESAMHNLLSLFGDGDFIDVSRDAFFPVFLGLAKNKTFDDLFLDLEELLARFLATEKGLAYIMDRSISQRIRLGIILFKSVWELLNILRRAPRSPDSLE
jgi:hypothetical protein